MTLLGIALMDLTRKDARAKHPIIINVEMATAWKLGNDVMGMLTAVITRMRPIVHLALENINSNVKLQENV